MKALICGEKSVQYNTTFFSICQKTGIFPTIKGSSKLDKMILFQIKIWYWQQIFLSVTPLSKYNINRLLPPIIAQACWPQERGGRPRKHKGYSLKSWWPPNRVAIKGNFYCTSALTGREPWRSTVLMIRSISITICIIPQARFWSDSLVY